MYLYKNFIIYTFTLYKSEARTSGYIQGREDQRRYIESAISSGSAKGIGKGQDRGPEVIYVII
jgi:hypothetical protein